MTLTVSEVKAAELREKPYKLADSGGLYLLVNPNGTKWWRWKYRFRGKEKLLALGAFPDVSLKEARSGRDKARIVLEAGRDPGAERKTLRQTREQQLNPVNSFEAVARAFVEERKTEKWTDEYAKAMLRRLELNIFPDLGNKPIAEITPEEVKAVLKEIEKRGCTELAHRMQQACAQVFKYGRIEGRCTFNPAADLRDALKPHVARNRAAINPEELPKLLRDIDGYQGDPVTRLGLRLLALTFVRTDELIRAEWPEFDIGDAMWTVPPERVKKVRGKSKVKIDNTPHLVPLSAQALDVLAELRKLTGRGQYVLASPFNPRKHISENTLLYGLYRLGYHSRMTGHGFRSVASRWIEKPQRADPA
jgi:integrase